MFSLLFFKALHINTARYFYNMFIYTKCKQWFVNLIINRDKTNLSSDLQFFFLDQYMKSWKRTYSKSKVKKVRSIENALKLAKEIEAQGNATHVLITGSLHVVDKILRILGC